MYTGHWPCDVHEPAVPLCSPMTSYTAGCERLRTGQYTSVISWTIIIQFGWLQIFDPEDREDIINYTYTLNVFTNIQNSYTCALYTQRRDCYSKNDEMRLKPTHYTKMQLFRWINHWTLKDQKSTLQFDSIMQWCWLCHQAPSGDWLFFCADAQCWSLSQQLSSCPSHPPSVSCWPASEGWGYAMSPPLTHLKCH